MKINLSAAENDMRLRGWRIILPVLCAMALGANANAQDDVTARLQQINAAMERVQAQLEQSQQELRELQGQLAEVRRQAGIAPASEPAGPAAAVQLAEAVEELREKQGMHDAQIATEAQTKVESGSKYPLTLSGMILMSGFVNRGAVDIAATPSIALPGAGSTGATLRQTIVGLDAQGPHIFGARSHAGLRMDFDGQAPGVSGYVPGYAMNLVRLRTARAELMWPHTQAFFSFDRPLLDPESPDSLTAVAQPALAWSGNLWTWNPQAGVTQDVDWGRAAKLRMQAALIDVADAPVGLASGGAWPVTAAEGSRRPGVEARMALLNQSEKHGAQAGVSGYFAPHRIPGWGSFDSWAAAMDFRFPILHTQLNGNVYRGQGLGGLGGGLFKDYAYTYYGGDFYFRALDDEGGWAQWKQKLSERLEFNEAFGIDNLPAHQLAHYVSTGPASYANLARNHTFTANVIYSPSAYVLFSIEYRRIQSGYVDAGSDASDVIGLGAGYKF